MSDLDNPRAVIGGNVPPLSDRLEFETSDLRASIDEVAAAANAAPKEITGEDDLLAVGKVVKAARGLQNKAEAARKATKEPFLEAGREVDSYFTDLTARVGRIVKALGDRADDYQRKVAAAERARKAEEERKAREESDRQRALAEKAAAAGRHAAAAKAEEKARAEHEAAEKARADAAAKAADMTRVRGGGVTASARTSWDFEITAYAEVPLDKLRPYLKREHVEAALRSYVRVHKDAEPLAGVRVFEDTKANFR